MTFETSLNGCRRLRVTQSEFALRCDYSISSHSLSSSHQIRKMAEKIFAEMASALKTQGPALVKKANAVYEWKIGGESWTMDLKNGSGGVTKGSAGKADCTLTMTEDVFTSLIEGHVNAQQAFMQGKLKIGGNMAHAMKLGPVLEGLKNKSKL